MLVIHWAKHNTTGKILANGIRPACRKDKETGEPRNAKGVYVYPYSRYNTLVGNWRRNLKVWDNSQGNYNGFVIRLEPEDFPLIAGYWFFNRDLEGVVPVGSMQELSEKAGEFFSGEIGTMIDEECGGSYNWWDFEIIIPHHIAAKRIIKVIKDREPRRK